MLDKYCVPSSQQGLQRLLWLPQRLGLKANNMSVLGFGFGLFACGAIAASQPLIGLIGVLLNRLCDGLDGALARHDGITDAGGFLDVVFDFIFYALVPLAFAVAQPTTNALAAAFMISAFMATGSCFLAFAALAQTQDLPNPVSQHKSFYYLGGLVEGSETLLCFIACCLVPTAFSTIAWIFGSLCWITAATRLYWGYQTLKHQGS
ncbi:MAG: CDP-alcohol phosphatidyltransferase family protein [Shewanellaceae bacterium]|nr:CDP-alcohol phosphatidyltransferase family protein [Shewanellaceae bacterium]